MAHDAYNQGFDDYFQGQELSDNPFAKRNPNHQKWNDGWANAQANDPLRERGDLE